MYIVKFIVATMTDIVKELKTKTLTFRVTEKIYLDVQDSRAKCKNLGIKWELNAALEKFLQNEIESLHQHLENKTNANLVVGQQDLKLQ